MRCTKCGADFEGAFCPQCGSPAQQNFNPATKQKRKVQKKKKPIYKRWWFVALLLIVVIVAVKGITTRIKEKIDWSKIEMSDIIPEPDSKRGKITSNAEDHLYIELYKMSEDKYKKYVSQCKENGFTVDSKSTDSDYEAYNKKGYNLNVTYWNYDKKMTLSVDAPMSFTEIQWPESKVGKLLPVPKSLKGNFSDEHENSFTVYISSTTKADFKEYIAACADNGFNVDYDKNNTYYYAKNNDGYKLTVEYIGYKTMKIAIDSPSDDDVYEEETTENETTKPAEEVTKATTKNNSGIRKEFKEAMDSYEKFINEYISFMKKYSESDGTDLELISDYAEYMKKYSTMESKFEKWKDDDLNDEEMAYYIDVQARVSKKILEIS